MRYDTTLLQALNEGYIDFAKTIMGSISRYVLNHYSMYILHDGRWVCFLFLHLSIAWSAGEEKKDEAFQLNVEHNP